MKHKYNFMFEELKKNITIYQTFKGSDKELRRLKEAVLNFTLKQKPNSRKRIKKEYLTFDKLFFSTNRKTGASVLNFNIGSALKCYECINGHCKVQEDGKKTSCYATRDNKRLPLLIQYDIINYIVFNSLPLNDIIKQVKEAIFKFEADYVRFNERGSFYSEKSFLKCDAIAKELKEYVTCYSYTSNTELFFKYHKNSNMVLNLSLGLSDIDKVAVKPYKQTIVINDDIDTVKKVLNDNRFNICVSNCSSCVKCINRHDKKVTAFVNHGPGHNKKLMDFMGKEEFFKLRKRRNSLKTGF